MERFTTVEINFGLIKNQSREEHEKMKDFIRDRAVDMLRSIEKEYNTSPANLLLQFRD